MDPFNAVDEHAVPSKMAADAWRRDGFLRVMGQPRQKVAEPGVAWVDDVLGPAKRLQISPVS
jgi:hypothetical protein